jgi:hypothetical protein
MMVMLKGYHLSLREHASAAIDDNQRILKKYNKNTHCLSPKPQQPVSAANVKDNISQESPTSVHQTKSTKRNGVDSEHSLLDLLGGCRQQNIRFRL